MTSAQAKPFSFDQFNAAPDPAPRAATYTADDVAAAVEAALCEALESVAHRDTEQQTALLESIAEQLQQDRAAIDGAVDARIKALNEGATAIVKRFCQGAALQREVEIAANLLELYLKTAPEATSATVALPADAGPAAAKLSDIINGKDLGDTIHIETRETLEPGDMRIEWRGGAMKRDLRDALLEIDSLFCAMPNDPTTEESVQ